MHFFTTYPLFLTHIILFNKISIRNHFIYFTSFFTSNTTEPIIILHKKSLYTFKLKVKEYI